MNPHTDTIDPQYDHHERTVAEIDPEIWNVMRYWSAHKIRSFARAQGILLQAMPVDYPEERLMAELSRKLRERSGR